MAGGPMKQECLDEISKVMGRTFTPEEGTALHNQVWRAYRWVKQRRPDLTKDQLAVEASKIVAQEMQAKANRIRQLSYLRIIKSSEIEDSFDNFRKQGSRGVKAAARVLESVYTRIQATKDYYGRFLFEKMDALTTKWFGLIDDRDTAREFVRILNGQESDNAKLKDLAKAWKECTESMRVAFNSLGGDIRLLSSWILPQAHSIDKLRNASEILTGVKSTDIQVNRDAWVQFVMARVDRSKMLLDDGRMMDNTALKIYLRSIYDDILLGNYDPEVSVFAQKRAKANTRNEHRELHFKQNDDSWFEYFELFSDNPSLSSTMMRHISGLSRDIALLDTMGPDPEMGFKKLNRLAQNDNAILRSQGHAPVNGLFGMTLDPLWRTLNGEANLIINKPMANALQNIRSLNVASKLGQAVIASLSDIPTFCVTARIHKLDCFKALKLLLTTDKKMAARLGVIADSFISDNCRFAVDNVGSAWASKLSEFTMKATLLTGYTDQVRRSFAIAMLGHLSDLKPASWDQLPEFTRLQMEKFGIGKNDWAVLQKLPDHEVKGSNFISLSDFDAISDADLAELKINRNELRSIAFKFGSFVRSETYFASLQPDLWTRAVTTGGGREKGSLIGELTRNLLLFKSFPIAMFSKQMERLTDIRESVRRSGGDPRMQRWERARYFGYLVGSSMVAGVVANQIKSVLAGKDFEDITDPRTWLRGLSTGGALSFMYDMAAGLLEDTEYGHPELQGLLGPVVGTAVDVKEFFQGLADYMTDEERGDKHLASGIRALKRNVPIVNMWFIRGAMDRIVFNQIYDTLNPGFIERSEERMRNKTGQGFWWDPLSLSPRRSIRMADRPEKD